MQLQWRVEFFGGLRAGQGDHVITRFRTQKTALLLAFLSYYRKQTHAREELIELLWPECEIEAGRRSLSVALSSLRHQMEPPGVPSGAVIFADRASVQLNPQAVTTDVDEFEKAMWQAAQAANSVELEHSLTRALALYSGEMLPGFYEDWVLRERQKHAESLFRTLHRFIARLEREGKLDRAIEFAMKVVSADPVREEAYRDLMRLYAAAGQADAALRQYHDLQQNLRKELDAEPDAETRRLASAIQQGILPDKETLASSEISDTIGPAQRPDYTRRPRRTKPLFTPFTPGGAVTFLLMTPEAADETEAAALFSGLRPMIGDALDRHGGQLVKESGASIQAAFARSSDAAAAAIMIQQFLAAREVEAGLNAVDHLPGRMRMALHTGEIGLGQSGPLHDQEALAERLLIAANGGQLLCTEATAALLNRDITPGLRPVDLGFYRLPGFAKPRRVFQVCYTDMARRQFPPIKAERGYSGNLPLQLTRFFGREREMARLEKMLTGEDLRLVTLTGPAGTGKTRLAVEAAKRLLEPFRGAVWFVALAEVRDAALIVDRVMDALRIERAPMLDPLEQLIAFLSRQPTLLVLDNFEQLAADGAATVRALLEGCETLKCLLTSRRPLHLEGEKEFPLNPLPVPDIAAPPERLVQFESAQLFIDRAQAVKPDFQATTANAAAIAELCVRLDGIPLALELVAARAQVLTPANMLARLAGRLDVFVDKRRGIAERHRTLRAAIDWSYQLLAPELQRFLARLSVFRGGWTLEAAEEVCQEPLTLDYLALLREDSLILEEEAGAAMRFRMLETVREYAAERLDAEERARLAQRHARHYLALAEQAEPELRGPRQAHWLERLSLEHENCMAAVGWSQSEGGDPEMGLRFCHALWRYWYVRGHLTEGLEQSQRLLAITSGNSPLRARGFSMAGVLAYYQGNLAMARALFTESLAIWRELGEQGWIANAINNLASVAADEGDFTSAQALYEEALALYREVGKTDGEASALLNLGTVAYGRGDFAAAHSLYEESLRIFQELGDRLAIAHLLLNLGDVLRNELDLASARSMYEEGLAAYRELKHETGIAECLHGLGRIAFNEGDLALARSLYVESLQKHMELDNKQGIAVLLESFAALAQEEGKAERSVRLYAAAAALRGKLGVPLLPIEQAVQQERIARLRESLKASKFKANWRAGQLMDWKRSAAYALADA